MNFLDQIQDGRLGKYKGIPGGLPLFDKAVHNTQHGKIYGLMGASKSGKTSLLLQRFVVYPYLNFLDGGDDIQWIYYSLEMSRNEIAARLTSIFADTHSRKERVENKDAKIHRISWTKIMGFEDKKLSDEEYAYIHKINEIYIEPLLGVQNQKGETISHGKIEFIEDITESNPTAIDKHLKVVAEQHGSFSFKKIKTMDASGKTIEKNIISSYTPHDDKKIWVIVDHLGLIKKESGLEKKQNIDKLIEEYCRGLRNICKFTFVLVTQQNRGMKGIDRMKFTGEQLQPQTEDAKDTAALEETCDMFIAIFNPNPMTHLTTHMGYQLKDFKGGYRSLHVMASRFTKSPITKCVFFNSATGKFVELHPPGSKELEAQVAAINSIS